MKKLILFFAIFMPMKIKRIVYNKFFGWDISRSARIGCSLVLVDKLVMNDDSSIGHFNVLKGASLISLNECSSIASMNWITAFPIKASRHFNHVDGRFPSLVIGAHSAITSRHLIDCTSSITIGKFTTFAGFRSQILTHAIDIYECRQDSHPVKIGDYCFVGTGSIFLPDAVVSDYSVIAAGAVVNKKLDVQYAVYAGVPARKIKDLPVESVGYMKRKSGYVW